MANRFQGYVRTLRIDGDHFLLAVPEYVVDNMARGTVASTRNMESFGAFAFGTLYSRTVSSVPRLHTGAAFLGNTIV